MGTKIKYFAIPNQKRGLNINFINLNVSVIGRKMNPKQPIGLTFAIITPFKQFSNLAI